MKQERIQIMKHRLLVTSALFGCVTFTASSAQAQVEEDKAIAFEEVVVTASRRGELSVQDIPSSIVAIGESTFEEMSAEGFDDYVKLVPGLTALNSGPGQTQIVIRGVNTGRIAHDNPAAQAAAGIYINEVPVSTSGFNPDLNLFDLNRVEVLRGPQGTLFGASAMSGAIRLITNQPDASGFDSKAQATVSNTDEGAMNYSLKGMVNIPLVEDRLALRVVGYYNDFSGYIDNVQNGEENYNDEKNYGTRATLNWFDENTTVSGMILYQKLETGGRPDEYVPGSVEAFYAGFAGHPAIDFSDIVPTTKGYQTSKLVNDTFNDDLLIGNLTVTIDFDSAELVSSSSYTDRKFKNQLDDTSRARILAGVFPDINSRVTTPFVGATTFTNDVKVKSFTQEVRLQSKGENRIGWMAGFFYDRQDRNFAQTDIMADLGAGLPLGFKDATTANSLFDGDQIHEVKQFALFGEVSVALTDKLEFVTGLRWFDWSLSSEIIQRGAVIDANVAGQIQALRAGSNGFTPKFQINYQLNDEMLYYATASKGFRLGKANSILPTTCDDDLTDAGFPDGAPTTVNPDTLWNYEVGAKTELLDGRVRANASAYLIEWSGLPSQFRLPCGFSFQANAGKVETYGTELDVVALITEDLTVNFGMSALKSKLLSVGGAFSDDLIGSTPPYIPTLTISAGAKYSFDMSNVNGSLRVDLQHVANSWSEFSNNTSALELPSYTTIDLALNLDFAEVGVTIFAKNITNERVVTNIDPERNLPPQISVARPRTYGITVRKSF